MSGSTPDPFGAWTVGRMVPMPSSLPEGWKVERLTDLARLESGHTPSRRRPDYWGGDVPWVSLNDIGALGEPSIATTLEKITQLGLANSSARLLPAGTVIFSRTASVGKSTVLSIPMATTQDFANYVCGHEVHNRYLMYLFRFMQGTWKQLMAGSIHNTIYMPVFKRLQMLLPPPLEQQAIAEALGDADTFIAALEALIAKKRDTKQGAMEELLTGFRRLPGFKKPWKSVTVGELYEFKNGLNKAKEYFGFGTPILNYMDVYRAPGLKKRDILGRVTVTRDEIRAYGAQKGDVFFTRTSETQDEIGIASVLLEDIADCVFSGFILRGRPKGTRITSEFACYCFTPLRVRSQIIARSSYTTRALTNGRALSQVVLQLPDPDEQRAVAAVLSDMDADIAALEGKLTKARDVKQGMMQVLLTGEVRLA
jgi:type I restriction enzyme S subunit